MVTTSASIHTHPESSQRILSCQKSQRKINVRCFLMPTYFRGSLRRHHKHIVTHTNLGANIRFSPLVTEADSTYLWATCSITMIEITVCCHSVNVGQKRVMLLWEQTCVRWCRLLSGQANSFVTKATVCPTEKTSSTCVCSQVEPGHNREREALF